ncbi:MAG: recombinase family protein, partial [Lachnospiraceae bacterium]|nr:recombinase family protein [Lachnospiraceae bacterium]
YRLVPSGMVSSHGRLLKKLEIVEEKARIVRKIYDLSIYQGMGYYKIAEELNSQGIPAVTTQKWKAGTIRSILTNPVYMGYLAIDRRVHHDTYVRLDRRDWIYSDEQIPELIVVSQQVWESAQEIREARKAKINASHNKLSEEYEAQNHTPFSTKGQLALTGLAVCGYCGGRLKNGSYCSHWTTKSGERKTAFTGRYLCPSKCPERSCYSQSYLEGLVFEAVEACLESLKPIDMAAELQKKQNQRRQRIKKELEGVQKRQKALEYDIQTLEEKIPEAIRGDYYFNPEKLSTLIKDKERLCMELEENAQQLKDELTELVDMGGCRERLTAMFPDWKEIFKGADIKTKKMLLFSMIGQIQVKDADIHIKY